MVRHVMFAVVVALVAHGHASAKGVPTGTTKAPGPTAVQPSDVATQVSVGASAAGADKQTLRIAPPLRCDRITTADGLPNSNVHAIVQDKNGFIWLGTQDGLARYDGINIRVYRPTEKDPASVSSGYITALTLDPSGKMWVGTAESGVDLYDPDTDKFTRFVKGQGGLSSEGVTAIARDPKNRIWFAMSGGGLDRYEPQTNTFTAFQAAPLDAAITAISADSKGNLWLGTQADGVIRWSPDGGAPLAFPPKADDDKALGATAIRSILAASDGKVWIGSDGDGLYSLDPATKALTRFRNNGADPKTISDDHIAVLFEDRHKTLWVGTSNGLNHFDTGGLVRYQHDSSDPNNPSNLAFPAVEGIYQDAGGVMWVGGFTVGVCKFDEFRQKFGAFNTRTNTQSLFEDTDGSLWAGSYSGLYHYDWASQKVTVYHDLGRSADSDKRIVLESVWMTAIRRDKRGILWISMFNNGLVAFDPKAETYKLYAPDPDKPGSLPVDTIFDIWVDDKGMLWLASWGAGLLRFDPDTAEFTSFSSDSEDASGLPSNHLYKLYPDPTDKATLWVGTAKGGLAKFNTVSGTATSFRHKDTDPTTISSDDVLSIYRSADPGGPVWAGTFGGGLNKIDPATGKTERLTTTSSGLTNNTVFGILADADGKLWISTNGGGLLQLDPKTNKFTAYEASDGLQDNEFSQGGFVKSKSGKLYFAGATGFNAFDPKEITRDPYVPPVVLTAFKVFNQDVNLDHPIWTLPSVEVSYSDSFELQFAALSYAAPRKNRYSYRLEGFDDKFIETDRPFATYTKLGGGNYTLRVRATNQHGVWNETGLALKLKVAPPFWRTWPAYAIYLALLAAGAYLVIRIQRQRLTRAEREGRLAVVERDLALTGAVQNGFLPEHNEITTPHVHVFGFYRPADACSGDWWWHEQVSGGRHLIMVGDVTGHGPGPAMVTAAVATAFRVMLESGTDDVPRALALLNREVLRVAKGKYHMTMAALEIEELTGHWVLHSAGAPPMFSLGQSGRHKVHFCPGTPLGTENGFEAGVVEGQLNPTDRILMYTDGIPEIALPNGNAMGMRRFAQQYERTRSTDVKTAATQMVEYADQTQGGGEQADDWTFTMIEWH